MTKKITESLVGKKPATASKLFAEAMEARLDEISKKTLGRYIERAANSKMMAGVRSQAAPIDSEEEKKQLNKIRKRSHGISRAVDRLTKEDLDESRLDETEDHDYAEGKYAHLVGKTVHSDRGPVKVAHVLDPFAFAPYQATDDEGRTYNIHKGGTLHRAPKFQRGRKDIKEDLDEVEAPANFWNAGMAGMNPIQVSQKQPAEPGQFKATLTKSPKRLADQDSSLEGKPKAVRDETEATATSRGPKTIELTGDWHADVPDHQFDPKLDSETEYYPLFSQFKSLGAYPSGPARAWESEEIDEDELNEISKKTLGSYIRGASTSMMVAGIGLAKAALNSEEQKKEAKKIGKRVMGIDRAVKKLSESSASLMAAATKDEKKAAEQDKKKPAEFKKLHDKHEAEVKTKMKELGEEALQEGLFDPAKQPLLALWDEHARRSDAHGSGSRTEILKRIEDHVAKKHGQEGLKKMRLHSDLSNALKNSVSGDKGHLQALLGNMRSRCAMGI